jgi:hypothetical protein
MQTTLNASALARSPKDLTKTVTNFAYVRYDNNGGLNPVSPQARGLSLDVTAQTIGSVSDWKRDRSAIRQARPALELDIAQRAVSVFEPKKIVSDVDLAKRTFKKYSAFKAEFDPNSSKVDYKHYL